MSSTISNLPVVTSPLATDITNIVRSPFAPGDDRQITMSDLFQRAWLDFNVQAPTGTTTNLNLRNDDYDSGVTFLSMFNIPLSSYQSWLISDPVNGGVLDIATALGDNTARQIVGISNNTTLTGPVFAWDAEKGDGAGGLQGLDPTEKAANFFGIGIFGDASLVTQGDITGFRGAFGQNASIGVSGNYDKYFEVAQTISDFSSAPNWNLMRGVLDINPSGSMAGKNIYGFDFTANVSQGNSQNIPYLTGIYWGAFHNGTGNIAELYGMLGGTEITSPGCTVTIAIGRTAFAIVGGDNTTITDNYGLGVSTGSITVGNTITRNHGIHIFTPNNFGSSNIVDNAGLFIEDQNTGSGIQRAIKTGLGVVEFGDTALFQVSASPVTNDGASLGTTSLQWSDLFLASGGVVNWNNGDTTITDSTNRLVFAGASGATNGYTFDNNIIIGGTAAGTSAISTLCLSNSATAPSNSADAIHIYAVDLSANNATLGIFTETAVAMDAALVSTNSLTIKINGSNYKLMLA